jgi:hypothetical protein
MDFQHGLVCAAHAIPVVAGKPFAYLDHQTALAGFVTKPAQLKSAGGSGHAQFKPPGTSKRVNGRDVYPSFA